MSWIKRRVRRSAVYLARWHVDDDTKVWMRSHSEESGLWNRTRFSCFLRLHALALMHSSCWEGWGVGGVDLFIWMVDIVAIIFSHYFDVRPGRQPRLEIMMKSSCPHLLCVHWPKLRISNWWKRMALGLLLLLTIWWCVEELAPAQHVHRFWLQFAADWGPAGDIRWFLLLSIINIEQPQVGPLNEWKDPNNAHEALFPNSCVGGLLTFSILNRINTSIMHW